MKTLTNTIGMNVSVSADSFATVLQRDSEKASFRTLLSNVNHFNAIC